jgi:rhamnogalacturonan acetylesterase
MITSIKIKLSVSGLLLVVAVILTGLKKEKPVLYLIGDSTMASASPESPIQGWGKLLMAHFDTSKIAIQNRAVSGISSRTYQTKGVHDVTMLKNGMWDSIMVTLKPGDYVLMQFGHNDESPLTDTTRQRGSIPGTGTDSLITFNKFMKRTEIVHTYGWYMRRFIADARSRGEIPIICSPIPKNKWKDGRVVRNNNDYGKWAAEVAESTQSFYIDMNKLVADKYDAEGQEKASATYFVPDKVHTTQAGAELNASLAAAAIKDLKKCGLKKYINN